jgi:hypothetical protein
VSHLPEIVVALGVAVAAVWLPGALVIQGIEALRRRARSHSRPIYIVGPMQDL